MLESLLFAQLLWIMYYTWIAVTDIGDNARFVLRFVFTVYYSLYQSSFCCYPKYTIIIIIIYR